MRPQTRPTVLIVEDEQRLRDLLVRGITQMGYACDGAGSAEEALREMRASARGVVVVDLNLPGMDGMSLFEKLRQGWPAVQVIVHTGFGDLDAAKQAIRLDVVDFLTKPTHMGDLEQALTRAWQRIDDDAGLDAVRLPDRKVGEGVEGDGLLAGDTDAVDDAGAALTVPQQGESLESLERRHILETLARYDGSRRDTADALGISLRTLYYRLSQYQKDGLL